MSILVGRTAPEFEAPAVMPNGVASARWARNRSPVEMCGMPKRSESTLACVPLPPPGGPINTMRISRDLSSPWTAVDLTRATLSADVGLMGPEPEAAGPNRAPGP